MAINGNAKPDVKAAFRAVRDAEEALSDMNAAYEAALEEKVKTATEHAHNEGEIQSLADSIAEIDDKLAELSQRQAELATKRSEIEERAKAIRTEAMSLKGDEITQKRMRDLFRTFRAALEELAGVMRDIGDVEQAIALLTERKTVLENRLAGEQAQGEALAADLRAAEEKATTADAAVEEAEAKLTEAFDVLGGALTARPGGISPEVIDLIASSGRSRHRDFLYLQSSGDGLDELAIDALEELADENEKVAPVDKARDALVAEGLATDIANVTKKLRRSRLTQIRRAILANSYVRLLMARLARSNDREETAEDTVGLADSILHDFDAKDGPIDRFAELLTKRAVAAMKLDADDGSTERQLIQVQIRASI